MKELLIEELSIEELSIEEKARRYDEALRKARIYYDDYKTRDNILYVEDMEDMFPELKESEDERTRKEIVRFIQMKVKGKIVRNKWIAWLEKQGEQEEHQVYETEDGDTITYSETDGYKVVEPKFHEGQWVVNKFGSWHIDSIDKKNYQVSDGKGHYFYFPILKQDKMHLWTIKDAKDGDVLAYHGCIVIFKEIDGLDIKCHCAFHYMDFNPSFYIDTLQNKTAFRPATKEERDVLFEKMKEDCCEWSNEQRKRINELRKRIKI